MATIGARRHMPAEFLCAAGLDGRHHLELGQADMAGIGPPPRRPISSEDVSDLQLRPGQGPRPSLQASLHRLVLQLGQHVVRADRVADRLGGDMGVARRGREFGVAKQNLNDPNVGPGLQ